MKLAQVSFLLLVQSTLGFVVNPAHTKSPPCTRLFKAMALEPEPEGGEELTPKQSMPDCRMKRMEKVDSKKTDDGEQVFQFWMTAVADGALIKEIRTQILKDASKKANFPGFRKGQVPPYAQPQINNFAVQEAIIKTVQAAVDSFGLKSISGSDGEVTVHEDVEAMSRGYKGESLAFTATLKAAMAPETTEATEKAVVDVAADEA